MKKVKQHPQNGRRDSHVVYLMTGLCPEHIKNTVMDQMITSPKLILAALMSGYLRWDFWEVMGS